ncbi:MAG: signal recognition particle-docking protein FtsY [Thermosulfidibacteraceae bacterium]
MSIDKKTLEKEIDKLKKGLKKREKKSILCYKILKDNFEHLYPEVFSEVIEANIDEYNFINKIKELPSDIAKLILAKKIAKNLIESNEYKKALDIMRQVEKIQDKELYLLIGKCFYELKNFNEAKKYLEKIKDDRDKETLKILAETYSELGKSKEAGSLFVKIGDIDRAIKEFLKDNSIDKIMEYAEKASDELKLEVIDYLIKKGLIGKAKHIEENIKSESLRTIAKAKIEYNTEGIVQDVNKLREILKEAKYNKDLINMIISTYTKTRRYKEAIELAEKYKDISFSDNSIKLNIAISLKETGNELQATKILATLINSELKSNVKELLTEIKNTTKSDEVKELCEIVLKEDSFIKSLKNKLFKSKNFISEKISSIFGERAEIDSDTIDQIEEMLISFDISYNVVNKIINELKKDINSKNVKTKEDIKKFIKDKIYGILKPREGKLNLKNKPSIILVVGVNGTGKTTTIAKLGYLLKKQNLEVLFSAGDTFRAAAIEQLEAWGNRIGITTIKQKQGSDPGGVVYDSINIAISKNYDVVIIDTAGRLHTKENLMEELKKIRRVIEKLTNREPDEILLVLDALTGHNAINQAKYFKEAINITGIILTKLDSTAKGGIIVSIADKFDIPIKFIGTGEKIEDLEPFDAHKFVDALFD